MSFLSLLSAFFGSLQTLLTAWRDRGLRQEGAAAKVAEIQKETLDEVKAANDAQAVVVRGCGTMMGSAGRTSSPPASGYCLIAKPIYWSVKDTDATILAVKEHNAAWKRTCEPPE